MLGFKRLKFKSSVWKSAVLSGSETYVPSPRMTLTRPSVRAGGAVGLASEIVSPEVSSVVPAASAPKAVHKNM